MDENRNLPENIENEAENAQAAPEAEENAEKNDGFFKKLFGGKKQDENRGPNLLLRVVIGVWLCYIAIQMFTELKSGITDSGSPAVKIIFGIIFIAVGGYYTINSLYLFSKQKDVERAEKARKYAEEHPDEFDENGNYIGDDIGYDDDDDDDDK